LTPGFWGGLGLGLIAAGIVAGLRRRVVRSRDQLAGEIARLDVALAGEQDRLRAVLDGMEASVIALDDGGRITLLNGAASRLVGIDVPEGEGIHAALPAPGLERLLAALGSAPSAEAQLCLPGPPERTLLARATRRRGLGEVVLVLHDITEIQRLEQVRQTFASNVSHELRTPLSVIRANTEALIDGALDDPEAAEAFLAATLRHAERLGRLVSDLLDLSRIEAGQLALEPRTLPLAPVVQRVLEMVEGLAEERHIRLHCRVPQVMDVLADFAALEQVLLNLVDNAVKYGQEGGEVWVSAEPVQGGVRIMVKDDGPGIDPEHHHRLFERFYRVDPGRSRVVGGTGLGLAIVKHLVTDMGGQIGVRARVPQGTVFWVELPR